jgi:hypothetical protein
MTRTLFIALILITAEACGTRPRAPIETTEPWTTGDDQGTGSPNSTH